MRQTTVLRRGAILYQKQDGKMRVIAYASRTLTPPKKNYAPAGKLEFLALKWVITVHFKYYLLYTPQFTVYTDNNPLTYVLASANLMLRAYVGSAYC